MKKIAIHKAISKFKSSLINKSLDTFIYPVLDDEIEIESDGCTVDFCSNYFKNYLTTLAPTSSTLNAKANVFYNITPALQVDFYPTFQYQVMGHTDSSNYSNFFLSVITGLSYKF